LAVDLYKILGIQRSASEADIKKAYRRLAREFHPDVNKASDAESRFKEVQKAYAILSDAPKRAQYDQFGVTDDQAGGGAGGAGFEGFGGFGGFEGTIDDIFESFFSGQGRGGARGGATRTGRRGEDLRYDLELNLVDIIDDVKRKIEIFHMDKCARCDGNGAQPGTSKSTCSDCNGQGQVRIIQKTILGSFSQVSTCQKCGGAGQVIKHPCLVCHGVGLQKKKKVINVDIPAGIDSGTKLRVTGEGNFGESGKNPGDLYLFITVKGDDHFGRDGDDIYSEVELKLTEAVLGTEVNVPILGGSANLRIPEGTQPNTTFRLKGKGVPHMKRFGRGDHHVSVKVNVPHKISPDERQLYEKLAGIKKI